MFLVVGLMQMTMWALVKSAVLFPMAELVAVGAEGSSAMFFWDGFEVSEER